MTAEGRAWHSYWAVGSFSASRREPTRPASRRGRHCCRRTHGPHYRVLNKRRRRSVQLLAGAVQLGPFRRSRTRSLSGSFLPAPDKPGCACLQGRIMCVMCRRLERRNHHPRQALRSWRVSVVSVSTVSGHNGWRSSAPLPLCPRSSDGNNRVKMRPCRNPALH